MAHFYIIRCCVYSMLSLAMLAGVLVPIAVACVALRWCGIGHRIYGGPDSDARHNVGARGSTSNIYSMEHMVHVWYQVCMRQTNTFIVRATRNIDGGSRQALLSL